MTRFVRAWLVVCLGLLTCCRESSERAATRKVSPAADPAPPLRHQGTNAAPPAHPVRRRALLVGINDYSASRLPQAPANSSVKRRLVPSLEGAVNDVREMREMLIARYGFAPEDILILTDQAATRDAVLRAIEKHLVEPSGAGDIVFFYWSGHGSQVVNSLSDEPDHMDETIVPADSVRGAPDIRDKELRAFFNRILDNHVHVTVLLDSCHSASGARGLLDGAHVRTVEPDRRDIKDGSRYGPRPENHGALVLAATQDFDLAWESWDEQGQRHGAFSLAWMRAMRDAVAGEPTEETFLRARARLQAEKRFQEPVLAGDARVRRASFLGQSVGQKANRMVIAVERVESDGTVLLHGGQANGLTEGSELRLLAPGREVRIKVTEVDGFSRSKGRVLGAVPAALKPGALTEVMKWAAPPGPPLRVWIARTEDLGPATKLAQELARKAPQKGAQWVEDPTQKEPTHVLRWREQGWELLTQDGGVEPLGPTIDAASALAKVQGKKPHALFVQLPAPDALARAITLGLGTPQDGVQAVGRPEEADYVLAGRLAAGGVEYAWLRPGVAETDQQQTPLPVRTAWQPLRVREGVSGLFKTTVSTLEESLLRLRKIQGWLHLETPAGAGSVYELAVHRGESGGELISDRFLTGQEWYNLALHLKMGQAPSKVEPRYVYVFVIDSQGRSILLFPDPDTPDQNRFPLSPGAPAEISLGQDGVFRMDPPYGIETYFLLTSDEPIPNPWILDSEEARSRAAPRKTPLEELLSTTGSWMRSPTRAPTPAVWSVERKIFQSVPPAKARKGGK